MNELKKVRIHSVKFAYASIYIYPQCIQEIVKSEINKIGYLHEVRAGIVNVLPMPDQETV